MGCDAQGVDAAGPGKVGGFDQPWRVVTERPVFEVGGGSGEASHASSVGSPHRCANVGSAVETSERSEGRIGEFGSADQKIGQIDIALVVAQR